MSDIQKDIDQALKNFHDLKLTQAPKTNVEKYEAGRNIIDSISALVANARKLETLMLREVGFSGVMDFYALGRELKIQRDVWRDIVKKDPEYVINKMLSCLEESS